MTALIGGEQRVVPDFQPAAWVNVALNQADLADGLRRLSAVLTDQIDLLDDLRAPLPSPAPPQGLGGR